MDKVAKLRFGYFKEPNYNGWTEVVLTFKDNNREEFFKDYRQQVDALLETGIFDLEIRGIAD